MAKNIVSVHGQNEQGKGVLKKSLKPAAMFELLATLEPCKSGMEACSGAHDTARRLRAMGHDARIIAPKYVVKFRQKQKNDANDAEAFLRDLATSHYALYPDQEHRATVRALPAPHPGRTDSCPHQSDQ